MSTPAPPEPPANFGEALGRLWEAFLVFLARVWDSIDHVILGAFVAGVLCWGVYEAFLAPRKDSHRGD